MCGIAGFIGKGTRDDLLKMNTALAHRGPDSEGYWHDESIAAFIAHKRLSIIDPEEGLQPMWTSDGKFGIVFNGEIYNHLELRQKLEKNGHRFHTNHSDTEVLLYGYKEWGASMCNRLNGMWAFAIIDLASRRLFLSRDRFGQKPLYYSYQNKTFAFSSELKSLIAHSSIQASQSTLSLVKYYAYGYIPAPNTLYEKVSKLPAGHNCFVDIPNSAFRVDKYWDFELEPFSNISEHAESTWAEQIGDLLQKSVKRRLMSDVPLGIFLSGGIDSSAVSCLAAKGLPADSLHTFSIGFEEASFDETHYSNLVSKRFSTKHYHKTLSVEKALEMLPLIARGLDEPMGDSSLIPTYLLCRETAQHVKVALGGDGADELFAGYDPFQALRAAEIYSSIIPKSIHPAIYWLMMHLPTSHTNMSLDFKVKRFLRALDYPQKTWNAVWLGALAPHELSLLFGKSIKIDEVYSEAIEYWDQCKQENLLDKTLQFYTKLYLQDDILTKVDRASMLNSLEVRSPFLDIDLVNFVRRIPGNFKYRNGNRKYILKKALRPVLPREIINRPKKGFGVPIGAWFKNGSIAIPNISLINASFLKKQVAEHKAGKRDNRAFLWNTWMLGQFK
ncbi:MAG: asparagine synthase (glutamine-hydrolyzing) [Chitinivibrionales bacterium]|nr:asparagine synthase (glutamine-hydrolyzing) [Chitinivibrionales bacterium]